VIPSSVIRTRDLDDDRVDDAKRCLPARDLDDGLDDPEHCHPDEGSRRRMGG
jgi:hypothetical protein